jgi:hypothetical protein
MAANRAIRVGSATVTALVVLFLPAAAAAADPSTPSTAGPAFADPAQRLIALGILALFGIAVLAIVTAFILGSGSRYFTSVERLARRGVATAPQLVTATSQPGQASLDGPAEPQLSVTGPDKVTVGVATAYRAMLGDAPANEAQWTVEPANAATVDPTTGSQVTVTAKTTGSFELKASSGSTSIGITISAEASDAGRTLLPFIGGGWGAIIVSIVIAVIVAILGLLGVVGSEAIAALFGTLLGYLFGIRTSDAGGSRGDSANPGSQSGSATSPTPGKDNGSGS